VPVAVVPGSRNTSHANADGVTLIKQPGAIRPGRLRPGASGARSTNKAPIVVVGGRSVAFQVMLAPGNMRPAGPGGVVADCTATRPMWLAISGPVENGSSSDRSRDCGSFDGTPAMLPRVKPVMPTHSRVVPDDAPPAISVMLP
jgi:hypothetical protein